jgi:hypothetical protein
MSDKRHSWSELATRTIGTFEWSADSKFVYFDNGFSTDQAVYRVRISDQKIEQVAGLRDFRRVVTLWSTWFGLTPDGRSTVHARRRFPGSLRSRLRGTLSANPTILDS